MGKGERRVSEKVGKGERKMSEKVGKRMEREVNKRVRKHPSSCDSRTSLVSLTRRRTADRRTGRFDPVGSGTFRHAGIVIWLHVVVEEARRRGGRRGESEESQKRVRRESEESRKRNRRREEPKEKQKELEGVNRVSLRRRHCLE